MNRDNCIGTAELKLRAEIKKFHALSGDSAGGEKYCGYADE